MRNLKRALSLALASVMVLGLMVVGSGASYADVTSEDNVEAIEVLQAVGIMVGDENGNFNPDKNVTRNEMAVVMSNLMDYRVATYSGTSPFTDVPSWAEPYVAACYTNGITAGVSATTYGGDQDVTTAQAALMVMKALGYFQYQGDFEQDWTLATIKKGSEIGIFDGITIDRTSPLTRNDVAQMALNALKLNMVTFTGEVGIEIPTANGNVVVGYNPEYTARTSANSKYNQISAGTTDIASNNQYYVQLGEELYDGDLKLSNRATDDFQRPARAWSYDGKDISTYAKEELMIASYTEGVSGRDLYELLSASTIRENDLYYFVDGEEKNIDKDDLVRSNTKTVGETGRGVLTEVYLDNANDEITIASINTYLAEANGDYSEKSETISLQVYNSASGVAKRVDVDDVPAIADLQEGNFVLVNWAGEGSTKDVVAISDVEILADVTVTKFSQDSKATKLTVDGTQYNDSKKLAYDKDILNEYDKELLTDKTYNVYLDQYGYFIGVDLYSGTDNYVFITGYDRSESHLSISNIEAGAIFPDGTMDVIEVRAKASQENVTDSKDTNYDHVKFTSGNGGQVNRWFSYTVNADGVYTLKPATRYTIDGVAGAEEVINCSNVYLHKDAGTGRSYGNDDSIYITVEDGSVDTGTAVTEVTGVYTGVQDVELALEQNKWVCSVYDSDSYIIAAVVWGEAQGAVDNYAYILSDEYSEEKIGDTYYWEFDAILDGEIQTLTIKGDHDVADDLKADTVQELFMDGDGYVTKVKDVTGDDLYDSAKFGSSIKDESVWFVNYGKGHVLTLDGRTLVYDAASERDVGLTFERDAKAVVIQEINKDRTETEYGSVDEAYSNLADADPDSDGLNFKGTIAAVLDDRGVAQWVVFYDGTPVNSGNDPDYDDNDGDVRYVDIDVATRTITLDKRDNVAPNNSKENIEIAAQKALASIGGQATEDMDTTTTPNWTIKAVNMEKDNPAVVTFNIVWEK